MTEEQRDERGSGDLDVDLDKTVIAVALSGGGCRASLFGLGVLLALVDLALNKHVRQIASVSGGGITNGFIALLSKRFSEYESDDFYHAVRPLVTHIIKRGLLTPRVIAGTLIVVALPILIGWPTSIWYLTSGSAPVWLTLLIAGSTLAATLWLALGRGLVLEILLARRLFSLARGKKKAVSFSELTNANSDDAVEHVFCCTDLASGQPFYFSTWSSGLSFLRKVPDFLTDTWGPSHEVVPCGTVPIAAAVRASAALPPGIPPRALSLLKLWSHSPDAGHAGAAPPKSDRVVLSDGGIWNNLGTQCLLEDRLFHGQTFHLSRGTTPEQQDERLWPDLPQRIPDLLFVANASASDQPVSLWPFRVPLWAEIRANARAIWIGNANTVEPRVATAREWFRTRVANGDANSSEVLTVVIDIWKLARDTHQLTSKTTPFDSTLNELDPASAHVKIGTHLGPIGKDSGRALLARAYANTLVAAASVGRSRTTPLPTVNKRLDFLVNEAAEWPG